MNVTGELSGAGGAPAHELMPATMYGEHGLTREEVLGKTSVELGLWEDPGLRAQYAERLARVVAAGTPEQVMGAPESHTGRFLKAHLARSNGRSDKG